MIKKDYIERLTQQIAMMIAKLIGKEIKESLAIIDQNYNEWTKLDRHQIESMSNAALLHYLTEELSLSVNTIEFIANLLGQSGKIYHQAEQFGQAKNAIEKSLLLYEYVEIEQSIYDMNRISFLKELKLLLAQCV